METLARNGPTLSWRRSLSYKNQFTDLQSTSLVWFLYDRGLLHERVNLWKDGISKINKLWVTHTSPSRSICCLFNFSIWKVSKCECKPSSNQCSCHIETSQLVFYANVLSGFYRMVTLSINLLKMRLQY